MHDLSVRFIGLLVGSFMFFGIVFFVCVVQDLDLFIALSDYSNEEDLFLKRSTEYGKTL